MEFNIVGRLPTSRRQMDGWKDSIDTWKTRIRAAELDGFLWIEVLTDIPQVYRSTPHAGTGMTPAKLMLNGEIASKLPVVLEPEKGIVPEERYKRYQEKLRDYADWKRRCRHNDLVVEDVVFVATLSKGKLTPNFIGNNYVILKEVIPLSWSKWRPGNGRSGMQNSLERLPCILKYKGSRRLKNEKSHRNMHLDRSIHQKRQSKQRL